MIVLRDAVTIHTSPARVWSWLEAMAERYREWHPDHVGARWVSGGALVPDAVLEVEERLHGKRHRLRMTVTEVEPGRRVRYRMGPGVRGGFEVEPVEQDTRFTASIELGLEVPLLGALLDGLLRRILRSRLEAIRRHQAEEGASLKALLEAERALSEPG
jgi:uncharacterized protein YndB with AHSA1/START domain